MDLSRGVSSYVSLGKSVLLERILTRVDSVQVVKIRSKSKPFNGTLDVLLYVFGRVGHASISEAVEAAFRSDFGEDSQ